MKVLLRLAAGVAAVILSALGTSSPAEEPGQPAVGRATNLSAFELARAGQTETEIQNLCQELILSEGLTSFWLNRDAGAGAKFTTAYGRYSDYSEVRMLPTADC